MPLGKLMDKPVKERETSVHLTLSNGLLSQIYSFILSFYLIRGIILGCTTIIGHTFVDEGVAVKVSSSNFSKVCSTKRRSSFFGKEVFSVMFVTLNIIFVCIIT